MKSILLLLLSGMALSNSQSLEHRFENWVETFKMSFLNKDHRLSVFAKWVSNDEYINHMNARNLSFTLGHNQFSGMDSDDFSRFIANSNFREERQRSYVLEQPNLRGFSDFDYGALPESVDWSTTPAVSPVKDQGQCGSCWSFSTTGAIEGAYYIKTGKSISLSEQQLVDCDNLQNGGKDHGCNGGLMDNAFKWVGKNGGLCTKADYPYVSGITMTSGSCKKTCSLVSGTKVTGIVDVPPSSDDAMMSAVAKQPVSVAIEADQKSFQMYKSGVMTGVCGSELDHGVLMVGYGGGGSGGLWYKLKNSWGVSWGEEGYIRIGRGAEYGSEGQCGVLLEGSYPVL